MNDTHDEETVEQAYERVKKKPHWQWNEYDMDDISSYHMIRGLEASLEKCWRNQPAAGYRVLWGNPPRPRTKPLGDIMRELGHVVTDEWRNPSPCPRLH